MESLEQLRERIPPEVRAMGVGDTAGEDGRVTIFHCMGANCEARLQKVRTTLEAVGYAITSAHYMPPRDGEEGGWEVKSTIPSELFDAL